MRAWRASALVALLALTACERDGAPRIAEPADAEGRAITFLQHHVFDEPAALADRFAPEVQPADFPLRLLVAQPAELSFEDVWRVRSIDGRVVVEALITLQGKPHLQTLWLTQQAGVWRIAGWAPGPTPVDPAVPAPPAGARVPYPFAGPVFRGGRSSPLLPTDEPAADAAAPAAVDVAVRPFAFQGACAAQARFGRALEDLGPQLAACYDLDPPRGGRLTYAVTAEGPQGRTVARLEEATLLDSNLSDCLQRTFERLPVVVGPDATCTAQVRVVLRPKASP